MDLVTTAQGAPAHDVPSPSYADLQIARIARGARRTKALVLCTGALMVGVLLVRLGGVETGTPTLADVGVTEPAAPAVAGALGAMALAPAPDPATLGGRR